MRRNRNSTFLRRASRRLRERIRNLYNGGSLQSSQHLAKNYDVGMIPLFAMSQMIRRGRRRLNRRLDRRRHVKMACWGHDRFCQRLIHKCREYGSRVVVVNAAYTSKTCSECVCLRYNLGGSKVFVLCWSVQAEWIAT